MRELSGQIITDYEKMLRLFRPWVLRLARPFMKRTTYEQFQSFILPLAETYAEAIDASIACTYAMLAAESLGLGIPAGNKPAIALIVGQPATHFRKSIHRRFSHVSVVS